MLNREPDLRLFIERQGKKIFVATLEMIHKERPGVSEDEVCQAFPQGRWHSIYLKDWLGADDSRLEGRLKTFDTNTRQWVRDAARFQDLVVEEAVEEWDLPYTPNETGLLKMPDKLRKVVRALIVNALYADDFTDFLQRWIGHSPTGTTTEK